MSTIYNSSKTAETVNRAIDNNMGTTTTEQGASSAGLIISEDLGYVVECTAGMDYKIVNKTVSGTPPLTFHAVAQSTSAWTIEGNTVQDGTPTPQNPVDVVGVGELETSGEHSGQYKIPISSNDVTTNVYLGEVETTRKIKKFVLTGNETVAGSDITGGWIVTSLPVSIINTTGMKTSYCSHYLAKNNGAMSTLLQGEMCISIQQNNRINFVTTFATAEDFKSYLAAQYTNGTPVTVWYVLATEETGIVNEPLMQIGDYADSIAGDSNNTIPLIWGYNTVDVDTTVTPSSMTINYKDD